MLRNYSSLATFFVADS